jgi:hypothetical protein
MELIHANVVLAYMQHFIRNFEGFKTSANVTISNHHQDMQLTDPEIFSPGEIKEPLNPVINPGETPSPS